MLFSTKIISQFFLSYCFVCMCVWVCTISGGIVGDLQSGEIQEPDTVIVMTLTLLSARFSVYYFVNFERNGELLHLKKDSE